MNLLQDTKDFSRRSRMMFLTATVVPVALGAGLAFQYNGLYQFGLFLLTLLGVSAAHLGVNLSNDYFDFRLGADRPGEDGSEFSGGGGAITREHVDPERVRTWFTACFAFAAGIGLSLVFLLDQGRLWIAAIAVVGFLGGYFYTAPPAKLAYRGLGEFDVFICMGPAPVLGTFAVLAGTVTLDALLSGLPIAGLIAGVLWINEYTDYETDRIAEKRNLVVRLGKKRARWGYVALVAFVLAAIGTAVVTGAARWPYLIALAAAPIGVRSAVRAVRYYDSEKIQGAQADALLFHLATGLLCALGAYLGAFA